MMQHASTGNPGASEIEGTNVATDTKEQQNTSDSALL
jgi:hypothetical protein